MAEKSQKPKSQDNEISPGTENADQFDLILGIVSDLLKENRIDLGVDSDGDIEFIVTPSQIRDIVEQKLISPLTFDQFLSIVSTEFESLLKVTLYSDFSKEIKKAIPSMVLRKIGIEEGVRRLTAIKNAIIVPKHLKQDSIFQKTSKGLLLQDIKWEVNIKKNDNQYGSLEELTYVTLALLYSQPATETMVGYLTIADELRMQIPLAAEPKCLKLELQRKDVQRLIDNLQTILKAI